MLNDVGISEQRPKWMAIELCHATNVQIKLITATRLEAIEWTRLMHSLVLNRIDGTVLTTINDDWTITSATCNTTHATARPCFLTRSTALCPLLNNINEARRR